jgi:signal transduction histidine kinase
VEERTKRIKKQNRKLHEAYKREEFYKDIFSHDINNILQSLLSGIQACYYLYDDPETLKKNLAIMKSEIIRGVNLVLNIRKLSQLEKEEFSLEKCEVIQILKDSIKNIRNTFFDKSIIINLHQNHEKLFVKANQLLEDVFENILINAVRHNKKEVPKIDISISKKEHDKKKFIKFEFLDNATGIKDSMKKRVFRRYGRGHKSIHGMGLGLSLVKKIVDSYNGDIWVENRVEEDYSKGSNFIVLIPQANNNNN